MASVNVVLFGEIGVGKSSVINLIAGRQTASISPDAQLCTLSPRRYSFPIDGRVFHVWDTPGLDEPTAFGCSQYATVQGILELIQQLAQEGGVDLLVFCMRGGYLTVTTQHNHRLFNDLLCRSQVPVALVINHLEREQDMNAWWTRNVSSLETYGIKPVDHACITGLPRHSKYRESKANIERMLRGYDSQGKFSMPADVWIVEFLCSCGLFDLGGRDSKREVHKVLTKQFKLKPEIVQKVVESLSSGVRDNKPPGPNPVKVRAVEKPTGRIQWKLPRW